MRLGRLAQSIGDVVESEIRDHEERLHGAACAGLPAPNTAPLAAIPFPDIRIDDNQLARAVELLAGTTDEALELPEVADRLGVPLPALERHLAEHKARWNRFLWERATARS